MSVSNELPCNNERIPTDLTDAYPTFEDTTYDRDMGVVLTAEATVQRAFGRWAVSSATLEYGTNKWLPNNGGLRLDAIERILAAAQRAHGEKRYRETVWDK